MGLSGVYCFCINRVWRQVGLSGDYCVCIYRGVETGGF